MLRSLRVSFSLILTRPPARAESLLATQASTLTVLRWSLGGDKKPGACGPLAECVGAATGPKRRASGYKKGVKAFSVGVFVLEAIE